MTHDCASNCAKAMLIIFNVIFLLAGLLVLAIGIWFAVDPSILNTINFITINSGEPLVRYAAYIFIAIGAFAVVVSVLGFVGAALESKWILGVYIFVLVIVMLGELAAGIIAIIEKDVIMRELEMNLNTSFTKYVQGTGSNSFGDLLNSAQYLFKCCGINSSLDYNVPSYQMKYGWIVPPSCCRPSSSYKGDGSALTLTANATADWNECQQEAANYTRSSGTGMSTTTQLWTEGCIDGVEAWILQRATIVIGIGLGTACVEIFGFIFAVCLCRNVDDD